MIYLADRITYDPDLCDGKPTIRGMRITVQTVLEFLAAGNTSEQILEEFEFLEKEDILACLNYAKEVMSHYVIKAVA